jgi:hypothetical protein
MQVPTTLTTQHILIPFHSLVVVILHSTLEDLAHISLGRSLIVNRKVKNYLTWKCLLQVFLALENPYKDSSNSERPDGDDWKLGPLPQISHPNVESNSDENNGADSNLVNAGADRIQEALRVTIRIMKEEADNMSNGRVKRSMTWTRVRFLQQNTVDDLVNLYMPGFSHKVKVLFTKSHLSLEDLCELPSAALDKKTGIYLLNAVRNAVALGGYVGSGSGQDGIHKRDKDHTSAAKPGSKEKGIVYDLLRQTGVDKMNRVLASFAPP